MEMERFEKALLQSRAWGLAARNIMAPWVAAVASLPQRADVLEVGTGMGFHAEALLRRFPGWRLTATDYDADMAARAARRLARFGERARVERADATALAYADGSFDVVVSVFVWHHVGDWERATAEAARVLRPGGMLLLADLLEGFFAGPIRTLFPPVRTYRFEEVPPALTDAGFARWRADRVGAIGYRLAATSTPPAPAAVTET